MAERASATASGRTQRNVAVGTEGCSRLAARWQRTSRALLGRRRTVINRDRNGRHRGLINRDARDIDAGHSRRRPNIIITNGDCWDAGLLSASRLVGKHNARHRWSSLFFRSTPVLVETDNRAPWTIADSRWLRQLGTAILHAHACGIPDILASKLDTITHLYIRIRRGPRITVSIGCVKGVSGASRWVSVDFDAVDGLVGHHWGGRLVRVVFVGKGMHGRARSSRPLRRVAGFFPNLIPCKGDGDDFTAYIAAARAALLLVHPRTHAAIRLAAGDCGAGTTRLGRHATILNVAIAALGASRCRAVANITAHARRRHLFGMLANISGSSMGVAVLSKMRTVPVSALGSGRRHVSVLVLPNKLSCFVESSVVQASVVCGSLLRLLSDVHLVHSITQRDDFFLLHPALPALHVVSGRNNLIRVANLARTGGRLVVVAGSGGACCGCRVSRADARVGIARRKGSHSFWLRHVL